MSSEIAAMIKIPEVFIASILFPAAIMAVYWRRNIDRFRKSLTRLKEVLEYEATRRESLFEKYRAARDTAYKLKRLGAPLNYNTFLAFNTIIALTLALAGIKLLNNPYLAVISAPLWLIFSHQLADRLYRTKVKAKIDAQAQLVLQLLAELYQVSDNLLEAIERVIPSTPQPLKRELEMLLLKVRTNQDMDRCLIDFAANIDNRDIEIFVHGIILADQYGTDTHEVITENANVIRERIALREELINETKGKKVIIHLFMLALPALFFWLFFGSEDARQVFTQSQKGQYLVAVLGLVEYLCWYFDSRKGVAEEL